MQKLIGSYECRVDSKGRLPLPIAFKKQLEEIMMDGFVLKRSIFQSCLEIYPMQEWQEVTEKIHELNRFKKKNNDFIRRFSAGAKLVEADANGRILIAKDLLQFACIEREVVVFAAVNILEVWDKERYEQAIALDTEGFAQLAEEVMGNKESDVS